MELSLYFNIHEITTDNGLAVAPVPALRMYFKRYAYLADTEIWFIILPDWFLRFLS